MKREKSYNKYARFLGFMLIILVTVILTIDVRSGIDDYIIFRVVDKIFLISLATFGYHLIMAEECECEAFARREVDRIISEVNSKEKSK